MNVELSETVQDDGDVFRVHSSIYTDPSIFDPRRKAATPRISTSSGWRWSARRESSPTGA